MYNMWTISNARNRKGFTLIELMIVIAIIIILAAIAIPNYLKMTERAKKSRVASDFETLATALEAYRTDWGQYPVQTSLAPFGKNTDGSSISSTLAKELTGVGASTNTSSNTTATGETGGIEYIKAKTIQSMVDPFIPTEDYKYGSQDGTAWVLSCHYKTAGTDHYLWRTDSTTQLTDSTTEPSVP